MSSADYLNDINKYKALKSKLNKIVQNLKYSIGYVNTLGNTLRNSYSIDDDDTPVETRTIALRTSMSDTYTTLTKKVIPAIDDAIASSKKKYEQALSAERAAAAAKKKAAAKSSSSKKSYDQRVKERVDKIPASIPSAERQKLIDQIKLEERNK
jgi:hypothetical protein